MARDNVEIVRSIYERWREGNFRADPDELDPHVLFILPAGFPDAGTYLGTRALADYTRGFLEPWTHISIEAEEVIPAGDTVFGSVLQRGVGDASGAETEFRYFQLWSLRGGKVIRLENFRERDEALAAAGLPR
jgi:uncharacterized protein